MISTLLPPDARQVLIDASKTPVTAADAMARRKAIDQAIQRVKRKYPQFFKDSVIHATKGA